MAIQHGSPSPAHDPHELGVWLRDGWRIMIRHFPTLVLIALVSDVPLTFISRSVESIDNGFVSTLLGLASIAIITPLAKAITIVAIAGWESGESGAVRRAFRLFCTRLPVVLAASILWCIAVFVGFGLLIVPGVFILILGQCLMGAVILEGRSLKSAVRRSYELVWPPSYKWSRFFNVFALFCMVQAVAGIASGILEAILGMFLSDWPLDVITRTLTSPLAFAPLAVMFLRTSRVSSS